MDVDYGLNRALDSMRGREILADMSAMCRIRFKLYLLKYSYDTL